MRLIDADKLKQHFAWWHEGGEEADRQAEIFEQIIDVQPTIEERKAGKWIEMGTKEAWCYKCDQCGKLEYFAQNFCPNCGASMEVDDAGDL